MLNRSPRPWLAGAVLLGLIPQAWGGWAPTQAEMGALPPYCAAKFNEGANPEGAKMWRDTMGDDFMHIHHYCAGLNFLNRARGSFSPDDRGVLGAAIGEFDYVLTHASAGFYLRPEILTNRAIALSMMKKDGEAVGNLLQAIDIDPAQPHAYMALADLYENMRNRTKALETVTEGLRHNPNARGLQRRYTELGGKLPYPAPLHVAPVDAQTGASDASSAAAPAEPEAPAKIGSPTNPYCRFCPD